jgi:GT2 family glycosyltransferase
MDGLDAAFAGNSYGDDYDLALRMRAAGLRTVFDPLPSVRHTRAPMGGLRLDDPMNRCAEWKKYLSLWIFHLRHVPPKWKRWSLYNGILRKSLLLRHNAVRPWRWPVVAWGLLRAWRAARKVPMPQGCATRSVGQRPASV